MAEIGAKALICFVLLYFVGISDALEDHSVESRGKKKKLALLFYFAELVIKKLFIFKIFYAIIFFIVLHKAGYFLTFFLKYFKHQKHHDFHEVEYHSPPHYKEYGPPSYSYGPPDSHYGPPDSNYGPPESSYQPYRRYNPRGLTDTVKA